MNAGGPKTLLMVEDHAMVREALADHLGGLFPCVNLLQAHSLASARAVLVSHTPDVVLLDLKLPDATGFSALAALRAWAPHSAIVVLSGMVGPPLASAIHALGAAAALNKNARRQELADLLARWLDPPHAPPRTAPPMPGTRLTPQQLVVLEHTLTGLSNKDIARLTGLSAGTVRNHLSEVFLTLGVASRTELLALFQS